MPVPLHAPPPLTHQDGLPPFSAQRATLTHPPLNSASAAPHRERPAATTPAFFSSPPRPLSASGDAARSRTERGEAAGSQHQVSTGRMFDAVLRDDRPAAAAAAAVLDTSTTHPPSSTASSSASSFTADPATHSRLIDNRAGREPQLRPRNISSSEMDAAPPYPISSHHLHPTSTAAAAAGTVVRVPLPTLVEQQKARIHDLIYERDGLTEELQELRDLFHRLSEDYEQAAQESEARQLTLERVQVQHAVGQEELAQARATTEQLRQRIRDFEGEWETRTKHLRDQLDVLSEERDAAQEQRDGCMSELSRLRQQLQQLQAKLFNAEGEHREALRVQTESHAQEMRLALQEKAEQLQTRAAATRLEALLTQQQLTQIGTKQTAAEEDRAALQWRIAELETVVERREHLRGELGRMVTSLRAQVADHERQSRSDAQRYTQRVHELEQTYEAQVHQEQHRCLILKDELTAARRALQEVHHQHESQAEAHAAHARETAARAARQEDELREQLRQARASLAAATALATQHEAVALRCQREVEALRSAAAHHQEQHAQLEETQTAQAQQLRRAEGKAEILQTRLQEKEREAELLRCTMEQTAWTREAREAMQHSLAALCGVPRAAAVRWLQGTAADAPRLEWPPAAFSSSSSPKEPNSSPTAVPPAASPASPPASTSPVGQEQQRAEIKVENATPSATAAEGDDVRSPVRDAAASSQVAAAQHIESIERTVARDSTRPSGDATPAERLRTYAAPPLHPGSPRALGNTSSAALLPLRTHSFAFAQTSTLASPQGTPSPARHQYNVAEGESAEQDSQVQPAEGPAPAVESDEKFFDDFHTPMGRRDGLRPPLWSAPRAGSHERQVPRPVAPQGTVRSPAKEMGGGGLQAAELLAQLPLRAPAAAAAAASASATPLATPFSSSSASAHAARRPRRTDHLSDDTNGLQQYLRETVQQVLATQQQQQQQQQGSRSGGPPPLLQHRASPPVTRASAAAVQRQGLPGHSHYTQLFDGSPLRSAAGSRAVTEDEAAEEDFGSVSRPRSVLSVLPWQQKTPISTSAAVVPAGGESAPRVALRTPTPATTSSTQSRPHASLKTQSVTRVRIDAGVAETLEQLARRQQRLLESLAKESEAAPAKMREVVNPGAPSDEVTRARAGAVPPTAWASPPPPPPVSVYGQTPSAVPPEVSETTGSDAGIDPRQLSYATAATTTTAVTASSVQAERRWQPRGLAAAPRPLDTASTDRQGMTPSAMVATAATPPAAPALPAESVTSASSNTAGGGDRALQGGMVAHSRTLADASAGVTRGAEQPTSERAEEDGGLFTAATTTSALTSVSDASSLTQLERRFAQPFHRQ